jgi:HK97 family phage major capsid protein
MNVTLPQGVQSISVPRIATGTTTSTEPDLTAPSNTDFTDALITSPVVLITGESLVSQQLVDQSPADASTDSVVAADLLSSYNGTLEVQLINGSGSSGQLTGLLNVSGINTITYTDASPTASEMVPFLGQAIAAVAQNRKTTANATFVTSSSRAAWFVSSEDTAGRPLGLSNAPASGQFDLLTYRTVKTDNMPRTISSTQEPILFIRGGDCILYESEPTVTVATDQSLSGDLQLRIIYRRYCAFVVRYPTAVTAVLGSGMTPVSGF